MGWDGNIMEQSTQLLTKNSLRMDGGHLYEEVDPYEVDPDVMIVLPESSRLQDSPEE